MHAGPSRISCASVPLPAVARPGDGALAVDVQKCRERVDQFILSYLGPKQKALRATSFAAPLCALRDENICQSLNTVSKPPLADGCDSDCSTATPSTAGAESDASDDNDFSDDEVAQKSDQAGCPNPTSTPGLSLIHI